MGDFSFVAEKRFFSSLGSKSLHAVQSRPGAGIGVPVGEGSAVFFSPPVPARRASGQSSEPLPSS